MAQLIDSEYEGTALIADPIHRYMQFTVPEKKGEVTEKALIDSAWVQRLRYIYQLQSARWVFPSAEHSRFQHSLGAMHLAGEFAKHLYPSLRKVLGDECPSAPFIEEYMRVTGLLHNLDYVSRDSYMCGVAIGPIDRERLIHYTFFSPKGLTLHKAGNSALTMFLNARLYLYTNVYYHRTTRAIDLHLREIFPETMRVLFPGNPLEHMDEYLYLTDWSLLEEVSRWRRNKGELEALAKEWETVLHREVKWKMAYDRTLSLNELHYGVALIQDTDWEKRIRSSLPAAARDLMFRVDMATQDPRPENPFAMGKKQIHIFDPSTGEITKESLAELFEFIPSKVVQFRVFALDHEQDQLLAEVAESTLKGQSPAVKTSV